MCDRTVIFIKHHQRYQPGTYDVGEYRLFECCGYFVFFAVFPRLHAIFHKRGIAHIADFSSQCRTVFQLISPRRKMALKIFSKRISHSRLQVSCRCFCNHFQIDKAMSRRTLIKIKAVKRSIFFIYNRKCCCCRTGRCDRRKCKDRKSCLISGSLCRIQRFTATHTKDHIHLFFFCICRPAVNIFICTVFTKNNRIHKFHPGSGNCLHQALFSRTQCLFSTDQKDPFSVQPAHKGNFFPCICSYRIITKENCFYIHYFNNSFNLLRRSSASSIVASSLAKCRRIRWFTSSLKKLEPGTAATPIFLIIHSQNSRSVYPAN